MAGLLDLPDFNSAAGQGLLAASLSLMGAQKMPGQKGAFGSALANAGRTYMDTRNQAGEQLQAQEFKRLQLDALKRKMEQEKQQAAEAERVRNLIAGAGQPKLGMGGTSQVNDSLPLDLQIGAMAPLQEPGKIDFQALVRAGVPFDLVKQLADSQNLGKQKVARTVDTEGPNGSKLVQGFDEFGQPAGQGVNGYVAPVSVNQGNQTSFVKPMAGLSLPMGMSPSEQSAAYDRNRSFGLQQQRFAFDKAGGAEGGKPQLVDGQWVYKPSPQFPNGRVVGVAGMNDKPLNESQGAAANFGNRAMQAHLELSELEAAGGGRPGSIKRVLTAATPGLGMGLDESMGTMMNWTQSSDQQKAEQAQRSFVTAMLRKESGASISPAEFSTASQIYFPQPNDSEAVILKKQKTREAALDGLAMQAGPGAKFIGASGSSSGKFDSAKEARYQEWKRRNGQ